MGQGRFPTCLTWGQQEIPYQPDLGPTPRTTYVVGNKTSNHTPFSCRMDVDQAARSNAQEYFGVKDPDYYEFEGAFIFVIH